MTSIELIKTIEKTWINTITENGDERSLIEVTRENGCFVFWACDQTVHLANLTWIPDTRTGRVYWEFEDMRYDATPDGPDLQIPFHSLTEALDFAAATFALDVAGRM